MVVLHDEHPAGAQQRDRAHQDVNRNLQPVGAPAVEGHRGLVLLRLSVLHGAGRHVGRVGDDDIDLPVEVVKDQRVGGVGMDHLDATGHQPLTVLAGQGRGGLADLDGDHPGSRHLLGDAGRNRPRAGTQVRGQDHSPAAVHDRPGRLNGGPGHHLGLRAHDEHTGTADELGTPQPHAPNDVLERLAALAAQHQRVIGGREVAVSAVGQQQGPPQQVLGQDAGIDLRAGHAGRSQPTGSLTHQRPQPVAVHRARRRAATQLRNHCPHPPGIIVRPRPWRWPRRLLDRDHRQERHRGCRP